jgi:hypothetical protein
MFNDDNHLFDVSEEEEEKKISVNSKSSANLLHFVFRMKISSCGNVFVRSFLIFSKSLSKQVQVFGVREIKL